jgi:hypothetical protein
MPAKKKVAKKVAKKAAPAAALSPAEMKAFQQKGFNKPKGFGK